VKGFSLAFQVEGNTITEVLEARYTQSARLWLEKTERKIGSEKIEEITS